MKLKIKLLLFLHFLQGKRTLALAALLAVMVFGFNNSLTAQEEEIDEATTEMVEGDSSSTDSAAMAVKTVEEVATPAPVEEVEVEKTFHQVLKEKFIDGGPMFMSFVLICLILGLALSIERILYLSLSTTNTKKLLEEVEGALSSNGVKGAKEVCRNTSGPVASIF